MPTSLYKFKQTDNQNDTLQLLIAFRLALSLSTNTRRKIFPDADLGISSITSSLRIFL
jgi:hypothetical protein